MPDEADTGCWNYLVFRCESDNERREWDVFQTLRQICCELLSWLMPGVRLRPCCVDAVVRLAGERSLAIGRHPAS